MLARQLGAQVDAHPQGQAEIGYYPIRPTEQPASPVPTAWPERVYQWHREGFDLPAGAELLAEGDDFRGAGDQVGDRPSGCNSIPTSPTP